MKKTKSKKQCGKIYLVGAGPGDVGLLTLQGASLLQEADVVVFDRLVNPLILKMAPSAKQVYVGKRHEASEDAVSQEEINPLLVKLAQQYRCVVRLKGGDPFVFGRGGEEASYLKRFGISFEVVPGVSAGIGAPAYAGIPITDRRKASLVTFITAHEDRVKPTGSVDWKQVAKTQGTLVLFMAIKNLDSVVKSLMKYGKPKRTQVSVIERATLPEQRVVEGTLADIASKARKRSIEAPAVVVIGAVNQFRKELAWYGPNSKKPLAGKTVLVTRAKLQAGRLKSSLEQVGARVLEFPVIRIAKPRNLRLLDQALKRVQAFDWVILTSVNAVHAVLGRTHELKKDARLFAGVKVAAIGQATAEALASYGLRADLVPSVFTSEALIKTLRAGKQIRNKKYLLPRTDIAPAYLKEQLESGGARVTQVMAYRTLSRPSARAQAQLQGWLKEGIDYVTFTSSSTVQNFFRMIPKRSQKSLKSRLISIGPITSSELIRHGRKPYREAKTHTIPGLVEEMCRE